MTALVKDSEAMCRCNVPGCKCDGIADIADLGFERCACCVADCPEVHGERIKAQPPSEGS